jgi:hypothetical protein
MSSEQVSSQAVSSPEAAKVRQLRARIAELSAERTRHARNPFSAPNYRQTSLARIDRELATGELRAEERGNGGRTMKNPQPLKVGCVSTRNAWHVCVACQGDREALAAFPRERAALGDGAPHLRRLRGGARAHANEGHPLSTPAISPSPHHPIAHEIHHLLRRVLRR